VECDRFADVAAELALGVLTGRERAEAVPQLDRCDACREDVRELTFTGEELLGLLPAVTPPAGFDSRVLSQFGLTGRHRHPRRSRFLLAAAAATVLAVGCGLTGWTLGSGPAPARISAAAPGTAGATGAAALHPATLTTASHQSVGQVFVDDDGFMGSTGWMYVSVDDAGGNGTVVCQLLGRDGRVTTIGSFALNGGYGYWGSPESMRGTTVAGVRLLTADGHVLASATFGS
jgi:hypothetical protein